MKFLLIAALLLSGCVTAPKQDTMKTCRRLCTSGVASYSDDTVECKCK